MKNNIEFQEGTDTLGNHPLDSLIIRPENRRDTTSVWLILMSSRLSCLIIRSGKSGKKRTK
ncbi:MAG: hypothetical protein DRI57_05760 [Deltaproteobacteria bacterium]|nr:MAG: hypothetical protein DRI57_05760 [Deltaproteobacteria bacterium]